MPYQILYHSKATHLGSHVTDLDILREAIAHNERHDIGGFLLKTRECFIQVLEGDEAALLALMDRIRPDPRHYDVVVHYSGPVSERRFGNWTMGYAYAPDFVLDLKAAQVEGCAWVKDMRGRLWQAAQFHQA